MGTEHSRPVKTTRDGWAGEVWTRPDPRGALGRYRTSSNTRGVVRPRVSGENGRVRHSQDYDGGLETGKILFSTPLVRNTDYGLG